MTRNSRSNNDFTPTDDELIRSFLYNRIHNNPVPNYLTVLDYELFGIVKNPWEIWEEFAPSHSYCGKDLYFFTTLKKKSVTSKRLIRTIGIGTWEGEDTGKRIVAKETNKVLGIKKRFRFGKSNTFHDGAWILHEYNLHESLINNTLANNYVLCRFRKNLKINQQNTGTRIDHQSNSHLMNSIGLPRTNVGQDMQGKTVVPGRAENDLSDNNILKKYNIHEEPKSQSNGEHKKRKWVNSESQYNGKRDECVEIICPKETIILGLEATTKSENNNVWLEENIDQNSRNQLDGGNIKIDVVKSLEPIDFNFNIDDSDHIMNKEEDGGVIMSWPELFSQELREKNEGSLIEEEEVQMLHNNFYKELLLENIKFDSSSKHRYSNIW